MYHRDIYFRNTNKTVFINSKTIYLKKLPTHFIAFQINVSKKMACKITENRITENSLFEKLKWTNFLSPGQIQILILSERDTKV